MKQKTVITNAHIVSPGVDIENATIEITGGRIAKVSAKPAPKKGWDTLVDVKGALVVPGFIDVHTHGALDRDVCDEDHPDSIETLAKAKLAEGCTSFLPTTLTMGHETLVKAAEHCALYAENPRYSKALGLHLEGPYINPKCLGAQNPAFVRKPDIREVLEIAKIFPVLQVSYAPEMEGGAKFAADCVKRGIVPSCGHTGAKLAEFMPAYKKGLRHMTHFCNQMTPLHHREIGMVGAGFLIPDLDTEVICDKIHLCPDMLRLVFARRPLEHIQMITDSLRCSHLPDGFEFKLGGIPVKLQGGEARLVNGGNLAGSTLWMNQGLKNIRDVTGLPLKDIVRVTAWNQAIGMGLGDQLGKVEKGFVADLAVLDPKSFKVRAVFVNGEQRDI